MNPAFRALQNRNYRLYFSGQLVSMVGTWMQSTVVAWLVYQLSHSAAWLGIISFSTQLPAFLASPFAGVAADRKDRRQMLLWVAVIGGLQAFALAGLVYSGKVQLWHVATLSVVLGVLNAFELTARHTFVVDLVGKADLKSAIACNSVTINGSRIVGPALAGFLIGPLGEAGCLAINGVSYLAVILGLLLLRLPAKPAAAASVTEHRPPLEEIRSAIQYIRRTPSILNLILLSTFICFFGFQVFVLMPVFAKEQLHGTALTLGWLTGAAGVGAILGAFSFAMKETDEDLLRRFRWQLLMIGVMLALLGVSHWFPLSLAASFGVGFFMMAVFPAMNTAIQQIVSDGLRGRVLALYTMSFQGAMPLGSLLGGWAADRIGAAAVQYLCALAFGGAALGLHCFTARKPAGLGDQA